MASIAALSPAPSKALVLFSLRQVGSDVIVETHGSYTTQGLEKVASPQAPYPRNPTVFTSSQINGIYTYLLVGPDAFGSNVYIWKPLPSSPLVLPADDFGNVNIFATGSTVPFGSGSIVGLDPAYGYILLPSGDACPGSCPVTASITTFSGQSLSSLGLIPGSYTWTWGDNPTSDQTFQLDIEPVPAPLPALGAATAFGWSRRLRRRIRGATGALALSASTPFKDQTPADG